MAKPKQKHPGGRPLLFKTAAEMKKKIDEYFDFCDNRIQQIYSPKSEGVIEVVNPAPYTMSGLARALGMDRRSLIEYANRDEFFPTLRDARERVHEDVEQRLMEKNATGPIFNLKNNFGWKDQTEQSLNHNFPTSIKVEFVETKHDAIYPDNTNRSDAG